MYMNMQKKEYLVPALEVVEMMAYEGILALSEKPEGEEPENPEPIGNKKHDGSFNHKWE